MRRSQWLVLGIGLIIMGFFINLQVINDDCTKNQSDLLENIEVLRESGDNSELIMLMTIASDGWTRSCLSYTIYFGLIYAISFSLGVMFIMIGFLEPKKNAKKK